VLVLHELLNAARLSSPHRPAHPHLPGSAARDPSQRLKIGVSLPMTARPPVRRNAAWVIGCEIWVKVGGTPPTNPDDCHYLAIDTHVRYTANFDVAQGGQIAHFIGVWVNGKAERRPAEPDRQGDDSGVEATGAVGRFRIGCLPPEEGNRHPAALPYLRASCFWIFSISFRRK
jgi:hypothetical protein